MTDSADAVRAERLAQLNRRRSSTASVSGPATGTPSIAAPTDSGFAPPSTPRRASAHSDRGAADPRPPDPITRGNPPRRRRSPATTAKIVTVGASTTAVLGMMAGYGIAEQAAASKPVLLPADQLAAPAPAPATTIPAASTAPASSAPPQVIVVVIDGATGQPVSGDLDLSALGLAPASGPSTTPAAHDPASPPPTDVAPQAPAAAPAPVPAPAAVDLAVPAPPPPAPAPAAASAPAPAPAPQPEATSGGS